MIYTKKTGIYYIDSLVGGLTIQGGGLDSCILHLLFYLVPCVLGGETERQEAGLRPCGRPSATSQAPQLLSSLTIAYYKIYLIIIHRYTLSIV